MGRRFRWRYAAVVCLLVAPVSSCLVRRRVVTRLGKHDTRPVLNATKEELIGRIRAVYDPVRTFTATLDMTPALGSVYKGEIDEFPGVRGFVIFRKPSDIRIIGLDPVIHTRAFDMVSMGAEFKLSIPSKNRFIEGRNDTPAISKNKLENLRPSAFLQAMLIHPPDPNTETAILEDDTDEEHALYRLLMLVTENGRIRLERTIEFDRLTLNIVRQKTFDASGGTLSDTRYSVWKAYDGVSFPSKIDINRPQDSYGVVMAVEKLQMNADVTPDKFDLPKPEGAQVQVIGEAPKPK